MSDIVSLLRDLADCKHSDLSVAADAADTITALRAEVENQVQWVRDLADSLIAEEAKTAALRAEVERLKRHMRARLADHINGTPCAEIRWQQERETLTAEVERLRAALDDIRTSAETQRDAILIADAALEKNCDPT